MISKTIFSGFVSPVGIAQQVGNPGLFVADQIGIVWYCTPNQLPVEYLNFTEQLPKLDWFYDERGLLGFSFHPTNPNRMFTFKCVNPKSFQQLNPPPSTDNANFSSAQEQIINYNCLTEINIINNQVVERVLLWIPKSQKMHNGGRIGFHKGLLYINIGDGGPQKDPHGNGQNLNTLEGKILRIDVDRVTNNKSYAIPANNPFTSVADALPEIYAYGFRNPWGMAWDSSGRMYVTDAGHKTREELDLVQSGGNYGWNVKEGTTYTSWGHAKYGITYIDPIFEYRTPLFGAAIVGVACLQDGVVVCGDFNGTVKLIEKKVDAPFQSRWVQRQSIQIPDRRYIKAVYQDLSQNILLLTSQYAGPREKTGTVELLSVNI